MCTGCAQGVHSGFDRVHKGVQRVCTSGLDRGGYPKSDYKLCINQIVTLKGVHRVCTVVFDRVHKGVHRVCKLCVQGGHVKVETTVHHQSHLMDTCGDFLKYLHGYMTSEQATSSAFVPTCTTQTKGGQHVVQQMQSGI